jgi:hypothetical protein
MDPRMYPLAAFVSALRQEWPLPSIQKVLSECAGLPYAQVAVGTVRAATDPAVTHPRGLRKAVENEVRARSPAGPPRVCRECRRPHDPTRPSEHVRAPAPEIVQRGAALARAALKGGTTPDPRPELEDGVQLPLGDDLDRDHMKRAAGDR